MRIPVGSIRKGTVLYGSGSIEKKTGSPSKTSYTSLRNILERTGVGFSSNGDYKIDIDDEQWEHGVKKVDPKAKFMRHKSWPLWETWKCIFGKGRATGGGAENISVAAARLRDSSGGGSHCDESDSQPPFVAVPFTDTKPLEDENIAEQMSSGNTDKQPTVGKSAGEKRKTSSSDQLLMDFLGNLHAETNSRLTELSSKIGYDYDLGQARQSVFEKLSKVDRITTAEKYRLCNILGDKPQRLEVFMGMPVPTRLGYLLALLDEG
ncbi:hypothetical protein SASPL_128908 [Salvia splendens]|uniref:Uncharacterized protein n=1 Tax=Salvia splendens TaxID=180675 RepID=A0A8X8XDJ5_SALSN|nr:hypothetical protein SASPL_128908 [Salvia splendens]